MIKKEITLCGKQVTLAYCFATEIEYKRLANRNKKKNEEFEYIDDFISDAIKQLQKGRMPDPERSNYAILAAIKAWCDDQGIKESPINENDLKFHTNPQEAAEAIGTVIGIRSDFYYVPAGEKKEEKTDDDSKNG